MLLLTQQHPNINRIDTKIGLDIDNDKISSGIETENQKYSVTLALQNAAPKIFNFPTEETLQFQLLMEKFIMMSMLLTHVFEIYDTDLTFRSFISNIHGVITFFLSMN